MKVSVCMITYGHEKFIEQAINGVLMQECDFEVELIISNDCSLDNTDVVIKKILKNHPKSSWIKYYKQEKNLGMMPNSIFALKECKGKYIAACEGDDYWIDNLKLQKQVDFLEKNPEFSLCFHDAFILENDINLGKYVNKDKSVFSTEDLFSRHFIPSASMVFCNDLKFPEWFNKVQSGDKALLFLASLKGKFKYLDEVMSVYRSHEEGVSKTHFGIKKVYDSAVLLNLIDEESNYVYTENCQGALLYEIETHLVPDYNNIKNIKLKVLINEVLNRINKRFKKIFK